MYKEKTGVLDGREYPKNTSSREKGTCNIIVNQLRKYDSTRGCELERGRGRGGKF